LRSLAPDQEIVMRSTSLAPALVAGALTLLAALPSFATSNAALAPRVLSAADRARLLSKAPASATISRELNMSAGGARAAGLLRDPDAESGRASSWVRSALGAVPLTIGSSDIIVHGAGDFGFQSETSIASNVGGSVLIAGYNDARLSANGLGVARSTDGGVTWN